ncbi:MAG: DUF1684 domain-containing protein [Ignavibacteria bacterium]|nr:DUF1684 domain-containing protein [Ignavibacteria bacterium]
MNRNKPFWIFKILLAALILVSCNSSEINNSIDDEYVNIILDQRNEKDSLMSSELHSPFNRDTTVEFSPLKYFTPDPVFLFKSKLYRYNAQDTVEILGTKGEIRQVIKEGYVKFDFEGTEFRVNVYKGFGPNGVAYHSIWFTDKTTGEETYGVGRYLDFEMNEDPDFVYDIDFNYAYNPYCSYSAMYSCPIPREEDYLDFQIEAGEKNFH